MIIADTNLISELIKPKEQRDRNVVDWARTVQDTTAITSITTAELLYGVFRLPDGYRKDTLMDHIFAVIKQYSRQGLILPFDVEAAEQYGNIKTLRESAGRPISMADAQIAAICRAKGALLATRNIKDFEGIGIHLLNPWGDSSITESRG